MILSVYLLLLAVGLVSTGLVLVAAAGAGDGGRAPIGPRAQIVVSTASLIVWGLLVTAGTNIEVYSGGSVVTRGYDSLQYLAGGGAVVALIALVQSTLTELRQQSKSMRL